MTLTAEDPIGKLVLGRYRLLMPLARGGQGMVFLARGEGAAGFTLPVVIKRVLSPIAKDPEANERFVREARITAQLRHPDIVSILDFERESDDSYVMVLEYVHGYDLAKWRSFVRADGRPFDADIAAYLTIRVLEALHYSHSMRAANGEPTPIIHRDISPGNVLIDDEGHVKITDFGIAHSKVHQSEEQSSTTRVELKGKLAYLSPELYRGALPSPQSDLYACAVMLHQLLVGENEFQAKNLVSAALRVATHIPTRVDKARSDVSAAAANVIARALAKDPAERHASARELSIELRRAFQLDLGEMPDRMLAAVRRDFFDPHFPSVTHTVALSTVDAALRNLATRAASGLSAQPPANANGVAPSALPTPDAGVAQPGAVVPEPGRKQVALQTWLWVVAAALATAFAVAFFATRDRGEDRVVFVDAHKRAEAAVVAATAPPQPPPPKAAPAQPPSDPAGAEAAAPAPKKPEGTAALTRAFAAQRRKVEGCFTQHSAALQGAPRIYVQFEVGARGEVRTAHLDPAGVEESELGSCLLEIARATRFEAQPSEVRFRIPLTARSQ